MKSMTRMVSIILSVLLILSLTALSLCVFAEEEDADQQPTETEAETNPPVTFEKNYYSEHLGR